MQTPYISPKIDIDFLKDQIVPALGKSDFFEPSHKIAQVVPRIDSPSSGLAEAVIRLSQIIEGRGQDVSIMTFRPKPRRLPSTATRFFESSSFPLASRLGVSNDFKDALHQFARHGDIIHTNSLWVMPCIYPEKAVRDTDCATIISPHGTLSKWSLGWRKTRKSIIWRARQRVVLESADCLHATSEAELKDIRSLGFTNPVAVIPNGIDIPTVNPAQRTTDTRTLVFLSRLHPVKGLENLLQAWGKLEGKHLDWRLRIVGPTMGNPYARRVQRKAIDLGLKRVEFTGELVGEAKTRVLRNAEIFVLPTHSENFGISVAEALAHGIPAVVTKGAPWEVLNTTNSGWWIDHGIDPLVDALSKAMSQPREQLMEMGEAGRGWVEEHLDWATIGERMMRVYRWLRHGGERPLDVVLD